MLLLRLFFAKHLTCIPLSQLVQMVLNSRSGLESGGVLEAIETEAVVSPKFDWNPKAEFPQPKK